MKSIAKAISDSMPKMNRFMLVDYPNQQIKAMPSDISEIFKQVVKFMGGGIEYKRFVALRPEERVRYEFNLTGPSNKKPRISMAESELTLYRYEFPGVKPQSQPHFYIPFLVDNMMVLNGKRYMLLKSIVERVFSRVIDQENDGIMVKPVRVNITFNRKDSWMVENTDKTAPLREFIVSAGLHHKKTKQKKKRKLVPTIIIYLLSKYGLRNTLSAFGFSPDDISFVKYPVDDDPEYVYYLARTPSKHDDFHMKVRKDLLESSLYMKIVVNILYTMQCFDIQSLENVYDPDNAVWRMMLGKTLYPNEELTKAWSNANANIDSVDTFLDPMTRDRFNQFGVRVNDIYELLVYIFIHIDRLMVTLTSRNMFDKRVDIAGCILVDAFASSIFGNMYDNNQRPQRRERAITDVISVKPMAIEAVHSAKKRANRVVATPQIYNDNWLLSCGMHMIYPAGSATIGFDPSMCVVQSINAFAGKPVGIKGIINPFLPINPENGGIIDPPYSEDIKKLSKYLPGG